MPSNQTSADPRVIVFDHPLIAHKMTTIRDQTTTHRPFRAMLSQIAGLMVYEVTRSFKTKPIVIQTPITKTQAHQLAGTITIVPVLRAGLGMVDGILEVMPEARVGHLGMARDETTLEPVAYLNKLPKDLSAGPVILVDPMLATGGSASAAISMLKDAGATDLRMICLVAAPEGIERLQKDHPEVTIYAAALDDHLNEKGYIVPGLGDAGDRMYGTV
jgi:uracil phosphoribosyltransferase